MIATVHPIGEVLGELLAQYEAQGLLADDSAGRTAAFSPADWNRSAAPTWADEPGLATALSACAHAS